VPATEYHFIARALDAGAVGIMVPMVENAMQARRIVRAAKYPPVGGRGAAFGVAHDDYLGRDVVVAMGSANTETLLIAQIETAAGVENVERIAEVAGIDVLWIGHFDLTNSLGVPGQFDHPKYLAALERTVAACRANGKVAGFMAASPAEARAMLDRGFGIVAFGSDAGIFRDALGALIAGAR
jgi:2-dehydro-3-deoxyglucarate aldolase/4-hydroxy-2-oxoheptanedioate aldolase